jgi:transposase
MQEDRARRRARYDQVVALKAQGFSHVASWHHTGVSRHTVIRWLAAEHYPERRDRVPRPALVTPQIPYLRRRWADGCHNA